MNSYEADQRQRRAEKKAAARELRRFAKKLEDEQNNLERDEVPGLVFVSVVIEELRDRADKLTGRRKSPKKCGIPSYTVGECTLEWGHDGEMHVNHGDGFYARDYEDVHRKRQARVKRKK